MRIKAVTAFEELEGLRPDWNRLLQSSHMNVVHLTHEWTVCWWKSFGSGSKLHTLLFYDGENELTGIAPMMENESSYRGVPVRKMSLIANGHSPSSDIIAGAGNLDSVVTAMLEYLDDLETWDVADLHKVSKESPSYALVVKKLESGHTYGIKENIESPYIDVNTDWAAFLKGRSPKFRKVLRNKINRADKAGDLEFEKIIITNSGHPALADIVEISSRSWKASIGTDLKSSAESRQFLLLIADAFGPQGIVHLWRLNKGKIPVAFEFHLVYNKVAYPIRADYDEAFKELSPGSLLEHHVLKTLFSERAVNQYYSCGADYQYLLNWTDQTRAHINIEIFNKKAVLSGLRAVEYEVLPVLRKLNINKIANYFHPKRHDYR